MHRNQKSRVTNCDFSLVGACSCWLRWVCVQWSQKIVWSPSGDIWFSSPRCWFKLHSHFHILKLALVILLHYFHLQTRQDMWDLRKDLNEGVVPAVVDLKNWGHVPTTITIVWCTENSNHFLLLFDREDKKKKRVKNLKPCKAMQRRVYSCIITWAQL